MKGFKNQILNEIARNNIYEDIINFVFLSLSQMKSNLLSNNKKIANDEEKIRTHLVENYLNNFAFKQSVNFDNLYLLFSAEALENYDPKNEEYFGRVDIKVININTLSNPNSYYIIECKRLDGSNKLNQKFVTEGICRFVLKNPKYTSFYNKNIMLGFIVKNIDIVKNINEIDNIQVNNKDINIVKNMYKCEKDDKEYLLYRNEYQCQEKQIELSHIFYDLTEIIE